MMEVDGEPPTKTLRFDSQLEVQSHLCDGENQKQKMAKKQQRRRSSFCAKRLRPQTPFTEVSAICTPDKSAESGTELNKIVSGHLDKRAQYVREIRRFRDETKGWERRLKKSEKAVNSIQQTLSDLQLLDNLPPGVKESARSMIGDVPDYAAYLEQMYHQANKVQLMMERIGLFTEACDRFAQQNELILTNLAEHLDHQSILDVDSPRTMIRRRLAVGSRNNKQQK